MYFWRLLLIIFNTKTVIIKAKWLRDNNPDINIFENAMITIAIIFILHISGIIIWSENTQINLGKFRRKFYIIKTFAFFIFFIYKKTILLFYRDLRIKALKYCLSFDN